MSSVSRHKGRVDDLLLCLPVPPPVVGGEWLFDNQFVPGTDCAEDPWLDFEAELKRHALAQTAFFAPSHVLDSVEPTDAHVFKEESCPEPQTSLSSSASLSLVLRTCHHCKTVRSCQPCVCTRTFCDRCIEKYPSIPQGPDPSGFRQQCPHCQELCTCARCRQRRMEEATPAKARAARSVLKRQHSEEDEEYVSKEDLATAALMHTEVRREALRKDSDFDDDDGCGSWKADDLSLSPLRPSSSSSSCGSRLKFMGSDDSSARAKLPRRSQSLGDVFALPATVSDAPLKIEYSIIHTPRQEPAAELPAAVPSCHAVSAPVALTQAAKQSASAAIDEDHAEEEEEEEKEEDDEGNDEAYAEKHSRSEARRESPAMASVASRPKKARRGVPEKAARPRGTQARKASLDASGAVSPVVCRECGTRNTPLWRAGPDGTKSLCNRCGIRWMRGVPLSRGNNAAPKACRELPDESVDPARSRQVSCK